MSSVLATAIVHIHFPAANCKDLTCDIFFDVLKCCSAPLCNLLYSRWREWNTILFCTVLYHSPTDYVQT